MPPHIFKGDNEGFSKPFSFLHSGVEKTPYDDQAYEPLTFQQSVTLTASMWNENDSKGKLRNWKFGNWGVLSEYSPLFVGLVCGFAIVLMVMTTVMLWRYCLLSSTKKICCRGNYGAMSCQVGKTSLSTRKVNTNRMNSFEKEICSSRKYPSLQRSVTVGSIPLNLQSFRNSEGGKLAEQSFRNLENSCTHFEATQIENPEQQDFYTSHLYLHKLDKTCPELFKSISKSTPALEDLYAKVNFSKKRKNRMRKDDAAVIAMSKSHSGHNNNSLVQSCSATIVYNERTAL